MTHPSTNPRRPRPRPQCSARSQVGRTALALFATLAVTAGAYAQRSSVDSATPVAVIDREAIELDGFESVDDILKTMVADGKVTLNIRARAEIADQEGFETSQAYTERTRLGFTTGTYNGMYFHIDVEDIRSADKSLYNAAGTNNQPNKTNIADPLDTELNQLYVNYDIPGLKGHVRVGRQRIKFNDDRFIGNVGWRQNEQTFDAAMFSASPTEKVDFDYTYVWDVNRIFGPDANKDFQSDSHLVRLSYDDATFGKLTGFAYLLDLSGEATAAANSSDTYGLRYEATRNLKGDPEGPKLNYILSWATQSDAGGNTTDYRADYYLINVKLINKGWYVGGAWEMLGSDNGVASFQTPLATLHGQNGWADVFLTTPTDGLKDLNVYLGGDLIAGFKGKAVYHWFNSDEGNRNLGEELDAVVSKKLSDNTTVLAKYAYYNSDDAALAGRAKFWLQLTFKY